MALETLGPDVVHNYIGTEPSGRNFNELVLDHSAMLSEQATLTSEMVTKDLHL